MLKEIADQFNDEILVEAARRYGANPEALTELEGFENYIYEYAHQGQDSQRGDGALPSAQGQVVVPLQMLPPISVNPFTVPPALSVITLFV